MIADVLSGEQGPYAWGRRDCLTTAMAIIEHRTGVRMPFAERYHPFTEAEVWRQCIRDRGGPLAVMLAELAEAGVAFDRLPGDSARVPGDLVYFAGMVEIRGGFGRLASPGRELVAFVDESHEVLHWTPIGLLAVVNRPAIAAVVRVHARAPSDAPGAP